MLLKTLKYPYEKNNAFFFTFISLKIKKNPNKNPIKYKNHKKFSIIHKKVTKLA